jgi:hypothetical protein
MAVLFTRLFALTSSPLQDLLATMCFEWFTCLGHLATSDILDVSE